MSILLAPRINSTVELVFYDDPEVTVPRGSKGWIPRKEAVAVRGDATVVKVSPLGPDDDARCSDAGGVAQQALARVRAGLRALNGDTSDEARDRFIDHCPSEPRFLLGVVIRALTEADDIAEPQKLLFRAASKMGAGEEREESEEEGGAAGEVEV